MVGGTSAAKAQVSRTVRHVTALCGICRRGLIIRRTEVRSLPASQPRCYGRLRPSSSWLVTQSPWRIADVSEVSPASTTAAQISASLCTFPVP
jgi:hypothetical protein